MVLPDQRQRTLHYSLKMAIILMVTLMVTPMDTPTDIVMATIPLRAFPTLIDAIQTIRKAPFANVSSLSTVLISLPQLHCSQIPTTMRGLHNLDLLDQHRPLSRPSSSILGSFCWCASLAFLDGTLVPQGRLHHRLILLLHRQLSTPGVRFSVTSARFSTLDLASRNSYSTTDVRVLRASPCYSFYSHV